MNLPEELLLHIVSFTGDINDLKLTCKEFCKILPCRMSLFLHEEPLPQKFTKTNPKFKLIFISNLFP